jgi:hypothetical protein
VVLPLAACSASHGPQARSNAESLVSATRSAGVAPGLTVDTAEALYGSGAPQICDALKGGLSSAETLLLAGDQSGRGGKVVSSDAITYERIVVQTYCPDQLSTYDQLVSDINVTKTTR